MHVSKLNISFVPLHWINKNNMLLCVHVLYIHSTPKDKMHYGYKRVNQIEFSQQYKTGIT